MPVGGGILYVEPLYVKAASNGYPLLQKILVGFGDKTVMRDNLPDALRDVGVIPGNAAKPDKGGATPKPEPPTQTVLLSQLAAALAEAQSAYNQGQEALKNGNLRPTAMRRRRWKQHSSARKHCRIS